MSALPAFLTGRAGAFSALAVAFILAAILVVTPIVAAFQAQQDEIADLLQQLGFYRAEIASGPALEAQLHTLTRQGASVPGVIAGDSTAIAQAQLQSEIKTIVETATGTVQSIQVLPVTVQGGFEIIAVECDATIPENRLKDVATAIATHMPYLFVDAATITAPPSEPDDISRPQRMLDLRWSIHGYRWARSK